MRFRHHKGFPQNIHGKCRTTKTLIAARSPWQARLPLTKAGYNSGAFLTSHGLHFSKSGPNSQYSAGREQTVHPSQNSISSQLAPITSIWDSTHAYFLFTKKRWLRGCHSCYYGVASSSSWSSSRCNPKTGFKRIRGPSKTTASSKDGHLEQATTDKHANTYLLSPKSKILGSHMVGRKHVVHPDYPYMIRWTIVVGAPCILFPLFSSLETL